MSNDIAPCGCEGHADNFANCDYMKLEETTSTLRWEVGRLRKRLQQLVEAVEAVQHWDEDTLVGTRIEAAKTALEESHKHGNKGQTE